MQYATLFVPLITKYLISMAVEFRTVKNKKMQTNKQKQHTILPLLFLLFDVDLLKITPLFQPIFCRINVVFYLMISFNFQHEVTFPVNIRYFLYYNPLYH